jgi:hypothetical protein
MAGRPEEPFAVLARLVGRNPRTYKRWRKSRIVLGPRAEHPTELDAIEIGAVHALFTQLGDSDGRNAWNQVKARLLKLEPTSALRVVWAEPYQVTLCLNDEDVGVAASTDSQPVTVVRVGIAAIEARRRFRQRASGL